MSRRIAALVTGFLDAATLPLNTRQKNKTIAQVAHALSRKGATEVVTPRGKMTFFALRGGGIASTIAAFSDGGKGDEPETMEWIDTHVKPGQTLWDIGANIGLYSVYAALDPKVNVLSFEPGGIDFSLLIEHIATNKLDQRIKPFCIALGSKTAIDMLQMSKFEPGGGGNAVGEAVTGDKAFSPLFSQAITVYTGDDFRKIFNLQAPDHIKLDVDGIEGEILIGLKETLPQVKSVCIEIEGSNLQHVAERIEKPLFAAGFKEDVSWRGKGSARNRLYVRG